MKILQVSAHLGGGAGKAISGVICSNALNEKGMQHELMLLQPPERWKYVDECSANGIKISFYKNSAQIWDYINGFDIIVINWWDHPAMTKFLAEFPEVPARLILWSHINGCYYPYIPFKFLNIFEHCFFTCEFSYENPLWTVDEKEQVCLKSSVVYGIGDGFEHPSADNKKTYTVSDTVYIGYVGTLNYGKLDRKFVKICEKIAAVIHNASFILFGDIADDLRNEIMSSPCSSSFKIMGYVSNAVDVMKSFDIFGYPLCSENYATTENSLLEAMSVGLPVVAINQNTEKYIVKDCETGLLARDMEDYADRIIALAQNKELREYLGKNARVDVQSHYYAEQIIENYYKGCKKVSASKKKPVDLKKMLGEEPYDWFLTFTGKYKNVFEEYIKEDSGDLSSILPDIFKEKNKSSCIHFANIYRNDLKLDKLKNALKIQNGS